MGRTGADAEGPGFLGAARYGGEGWKRSLIERELAVASNHLDGPKASLVQVERPLGSRTPEAGLFAGDRNGH